MSTTSADSRQVLDQLNAFTHAQVTAGVRGKELHRVVGEHVAQRGFKIGPLLVSFFVDYVDKQHTRRKGR